MEVPVLEEQTKHITTTCPICGKKESILLSEDELRNAREQHSLITKAVSHSKEGHVLTLYIDGQGIVRRKYCFEMAENQIKSLENKNPGKLDIIFEQMLQNSMKSTK